MLLRSVAYDECAPLFFSVQRCVDVSFRRRWPTVLRREGNNLPQTPFSSAFPFLFSLCPVYFIVQVRLSIFESCGASRRLAGVSSCEGHRDRFKCAQTKKRGQAALRRRESLWRRGRKFLQLTSSVEFRGGFVEWMGWGLAAPFGGAPA